MLVLQAGGVGVVGVVGVSTRNHHFSFWAPTETQM